jgi:hypothetical protein
MRKESDREVNGLDLVRDIRIRVVVVSKRESAACRCGLATDGCRDEVLRQDGGSEKK